MCVTISHDLVWMPDSDMLLLKMRLCKMKHEHEASAMTTNQEFDSFVSKFRYLCCAGIKATLNLNCDGGHLIPTPKVAHLDPKKPKITCKLDQNTK